MVETCFPGAILIVGLFPQASPERGLIWYLEHLDGILQRVSCSVQVSILSCHSFRGILWIRASF